MRSASPLETVPGTIGRHLRRGLRAASRVSAVALATLLAWMPRQEALAQVVPPLTTADEVVAEGFGSVEEVEVAVVSADGRYVVVYEATTTPTGPECGPLAGDVTDTGARICGELFDAAGTSLDRFQVNGVVAGNQFAPKIASDGSGSFAVAWLTPDGSVFTVVVRSFEVTGSLVTSSGDEVSVPDASSNPDFGLGVLAVGTALDIAMDLTGDFAIGWVQRANGGGNANAYLQLFRSDRLRLGPNSRIVDVDGFDDVSVDIALNKDLQTRGVTVAVSSTACDGLCLRSYGPTGSPTTGFFSAIEGTFDIVDDKVDMAPDLGGGAYLIWSQQSSLKVRRLNELGLPSGPETLVRRPQGAVASLAAGSGDLAGNLLVSWTESSQPQVFGRYLNAGFEEDDIEAPPVFGLGDPQLVGVGGTGIGGFFCRQAGWGNVAGVTNLNLRAPTDGSDICNGISVAAGGFRAAVTRVSTTCTIEQQARLAQDQGYEALIVVNDQEVLPAMPGWVEDLSIVTVGLQMAVGELFLSRANSSTFLVTVTDRQQPRSPAVSMSLDTQMQVVWSRPDEERVRKRRLESPVEIQVNDFSIVEGQARASALFAVQASKAHPLGAPVTVDYQTRAGTANSIDDFTPQEGTLDLSTSLVEAVSVPIIPDDIFEPDEQFDFALSGVENAVVVRNPGVATILNDDPAGTVRVDSPELDPEGDSGRTPLRFTLTLVGPDDQPLAQELEAGVDFATVDITATSGGLARDYEGVSGRVTFPAGSVQAFVDVDVFGDLDVEDDETFQLELSDPDNAIVDQDLTADGIATIVSDDLCQPPSISPENDQRDYQAVVGLAVAITDASNCGWQIVPPTFDPPESAWLTVTSPLSGTGSATMLYDLTTNEGGARTVAFDVAGRTFQLTQLQAGCDGGSVTAPDVVFASEGGQLTATVTPPEEFCSWLVASTEPWLQVVESPDCTPEQQPCVHGGTGTQEIVLEAMLNESFMRSAEVQAAGGSLVFQQVGIFYDDFDDGVLDSQWTYQPNTWTESGSDLVADASGGQTLTAIATNAFLGCAECTIEASLEFGAFGRGLLTLYGWYRSPGSHVALVVDEFSDTWRLVQMQDGVMVGDAIASLPVDAQTDLRVKMIWNGTRFRVLVDDVPLLSEPAGIGMEVGGTVGFAAFDAVGRFDDIGVVTVTPFFGSTALFADGFETGNLAAWSGNN